MHQEQVLYVMFIGTVCVFEKMVKLQEGLNVDVEGGAGHGEVKSCDDNGVKDPEASDAFTPKKDFSTAAREEGGV